MPIVRSMPSVPASLTKTGRQRPHQLVNPSSLHNHLLPPLLEASLKKKPFTGPLHRRLVIKTVTRLPGRFRDPGQAGAHQVFRRLPAPLRPEPL